MIVCTTPYVSMAKSHHLSNFFKAIQREKNMIDYVSETVVSGGEDADPDTSVSR